MLRLRRYRVFVICAAVVLFLLYRVSQNSEWETSASSIYREYVGPNSRTRPDQSRPKHGAVHDDSDGGRAAEAAPAEVPGLKTTTKAVNGGQEGKPTPTPKPTSPPAMPKLKDRPKGEDVLKAPTETPYPLEYEIPERKPGDDIYGDKHPEGALHIQQPPGGQQGASLYATSTIHWSKIPEQFPVPEESVMMLPTGKPKPIPRVQYRFGTEPDNERRKRESRLDDVRGEMERAWAGYRKYAWGHDELSPVSKKFRDPFCGWAATLVDALDTLWIMGMKDEFDLAYQAVQRIDFTTTPYRSEIPVFETIIRYLGGLVAAYDVSGGKKGAYPALLDKAVELAEILMGIFDTPNRMPILYYNWKPAYASQAQRAPSSASVAELGSMTMEFTRLAQLTGKSKYYDAAARITDAFEEWQNRGTALPGIFPEKIDASGCNRTAPASSSLSTSSDGAQAQAAAGPLPEPQGYQPASPAGGSSSDDDANKKQKKEEKPDLEFQVTPGGRAGEPGTGEFRKIGKRDVDVVGESPASSGYTPPAANIGYPEDVPNPLAANGMSIDWECQKQGLTTGGYGMDSYSMGASQDSTYEYFPKQFLLLGGLVPKYRTMYEKAMEATKKYLLYRPMIKSERDILFSAKVYSRDGSDKDLTRDYEITHLTCFIGGMFALGGKIFERPSDVEIGRKLTDGCVWAYEIMPAGIMPESAMILPCQSTTDCPWNETLWHERLDPNSKWRDEQMDEYHQRVVEWKKKKQQLLDDYEQQKKSYEQSRRIMEEQRRRQRPVNASAPSAGDLGGDSAAAAAARASSADGSVTASSQDQFHKRRSLDSDELLPSKAGDPTAEAIEKKVKSLETELDLNAANSRGASSSRGSTPPPSTDNWDPEHQVPLMEPIMPPEPIKPLTHKEYVANRLEKEHLPHGFQSLNDKRYLLRPEAIESVWYMYRITGDRTWQEKGWRMYQSVINASRTEIAHSAVENVGVPGGGGHNNEMESFWLAETLKYYYLLFTTPDVISLDEWVLNTEAHPFRRPT